MFRRSNKDSYLIILLSTIVTLVGCSPTVESIEDNILSGNYKNLKTDYEQLKSPHDKDAIKEKVNEKLLQIVKNFKNSEKTSDKMQNAILEIKAMEINCEFKCLINEAQDKINNIFHSEIAYDKGIEFLNKKEYEKAIGEFNKVKEISYILFLDAKAKIKIAQAKIEVNKKIEKY